MKKRLKNLKKLKPLLHKKNAVLFAQLAVIILMLSIPFFIYSTQQSTQSGQLATNSHAAGSTGSTPSSTGSTPGSTGNAAADAICGSLVLNSTCGLDGSHHGLFCDKASGNSCNVGSGNKNILYSCQCDANNKNCHSVGQTDCTNQGGCTVVPGAVNADHCGGGGGSSTGSTGSNANTSLGSKTYNSSSGSTGSSGTFIPQNKITVSGSSTCTASTNASDPAGTEICKVSIAGSSSNASDITWNLSSPSTPVQNPLPQSKGTITKGTATPTIIDIKITCPVGQANPPDGKEDMTFSDPTLGTSHITLHCSGGIEVTFAITGLARPPLHTTKNFTLELVPSSNQQANPLTFSGNGTYDPATGIYRTILPLTTVPPGQYQIKLHIDGILDSQLIQPNGDDTFTFPALDSSKLVTAIPGDIGPNKGDNFIDIIDYNKLIGCLNKPISGSCTSSDVNDDGKIDDSDLSLLLGQFGSLGFSFTTPQFSCSIDPNCNSGQNSIQMCSLICTKTN